MNTQNKNDNTGNEYLSEVYGRGGIYAKCVLKSKAYNSDNVLVTLETSAMKFLDAEMEKHRLLSSNSSSSRAIPLKKTIASVLENPFIPFSWRKNQPGMQGYEELSENEVLLANYHWKKALKNAIKSVQKLDAIFAHKQLPNRLLEPWTLQKKIITATEWENFYALRLASNAAPEIQELARCMHEAVERAPVTILQKDQWHLPYTNSKEKESLSLEQQIQCSVARCARISYNNLDNSSPNLEKDVARYNSLRDEKHFSTFEHQATPMEHPCVFNSYGEVDENLLSYDQENREFLWEPGVSRMDRKGNFWSNNFKGFIQYRKVFDEF